MVSSLHKRRTGLGYGYSTDRSQILWVWNLDLSLPATQHLTPTTNPKPLYKHFLLSVATLNLSVQTRAMVTTGGKMAVKTSAMKSVSTSKPIIRNHEKYFLKYKNI